jgi:hypothetical protein
MADKDLTAEGENQKLLHHKGTKTQRGTKFFGYCGLVAWPRIGRIARINLWTISRFMADKDFTAESENQNLLHHKGTKTQRGTKFFGYCGFVAWPRIGRINSLMISRSIKGHRRGRGERNQNLLHHKDTKGHQGEVCFKIEIMGHGWFYEADGDGFVLHL